MTPSRSDNQARSDDPPERPMVRTWVERALAAVAGTLALLSATVVAVLLYQRATTDSLPLAAEAMRRLRPEGYAILVGYFAVLVVGTLLHAVVVLVSRRTPTRWLAALATLLLLVAYGLMLWRVAGWLGPIFPEWHYGDSRKDPDAYYAVVLVALVLPPAAVVVTGKVFDRRADSVRRVGVFHALFLAALACGTVAGGIAALIHIGPFMRAVGLGWWLTDSTAFIALVGALAFGALVTIGVVSATYALVRYVLVPVKNSWRGGRSPRWPGGIESVRRMVLIVPAVGVFWILSAFVVGLLVRPLPVWFAFVLSLVWLFGQAALVPWALRKLGLVGA